MSDTRTAKQRYGMDVLRRKCPTCGAKPYQECIPEHQGRYLVIRYMTQITRRDPHVARK